jgi:hypothetical protein
MLRQLWNFLGNDPHLIAECMARPILADKMIRELYQEMAGVGSGILEVRRKKNLMNGGLKQKNNSQRTLLN